eukprot:7668862-Alexandrium_andersonii.AAC.1
MRSRFEAWGTGARECSDRATSVAAPKWLCRSLARPQHHARLEVALMGPPARLCAMGPPMPTGRVGHI